MQTLSQFSKRFSAFGRGIRREVRTFLPRERGRLERMAKATVQSTVYDAYSPSSYERTGKLLRSMRAYLPEPENPMVLFIDSDPGIAPAKLDNVRDGYPQFVAGEGPGIGFLARTASGVFPRPFHEAIFQTVQNEIFHRFQERIDKQIAKL